MGKSTDDLLSTVTGRVVPWVARAARNSKLTVTATLFVVIVATAACARYVGVAEDYLTCDEGFSWRLIQYPLPEMLSRAAEDVHPPLYYLALKSWSALFGRSILSLRCMSILLALGTIPLLMATVREACAQHDRRRGESVKVGYAGALLAAALFAVHTSQVYPARDARMYSMGVFLAVLTSWLLLRCLRCERVELRWWLSYGLAVGAFCHTHNYAFFTIAAQSIFVFGELVRHAASGRQGKARQQAQGFVLAGLCAVAIYAPWVPALLHQVQEVRACYWIPPASWLAVRRVLASWGGGATIISCEGGSDFVTGLDVGVWLFAAVLLVVVTFALRHRGMWFLLLLAAIPWGLSLEISVLSQRSIFHERYLVFAQVFWLGLWGVVYEQIRRFALRACLIWALAMTVIYNSVLTVTQISRRSTPAEQAMRFVRDNYDREGDLIVAPDLRQVNQLRYYADAAGITDADIRAVGTLSVRRGHVTHIASLSERDFIEQDVLTTGKYRRVWQLSELNRVCTFWAAGMEEVERREFTRAGDIQALVDQGGYVVALYCRTQE